ncbi:2-dehydropantoate 2-reductase [Sphingosinicella sp. BN140058]|uniref:2-dehydropantoate 2-reductase n=1 Tax=Sphingosinicella sp. BN140058 TaxID=1892855 RepID=UPI001010169E|nr:2-dehydropantoate 2-reductase [Sphingosinicella sp. BN140058]QAY75800.1 2-dehydropantoate 2-reductase [Sphingosinicella sp. BN140058]
MTIAILGAGSVGCFIGGAWSHAGLPVRFVGREAIGTAIAAEGLTLTDYSGWRVRRNPEQVDYATSPKALAKADIIALCVKSTGTAEAAKQIARHGKNGALVISFQNGVSNVDALRDVLKDRFEIAQAMVPFNVAYLGHGRFHKGVAGELVVQDIPRTRVLAQEVGGGPAALRLADDMAAIAWGKLLINLNNAVNALSGRTLLEQLRERDYRRVVAASIVEALDLLAAAGIEPAKIGPIAPKLLPHAIAAPNLIFNNLFLKIQKIDAKARSSMADDLRAGRTTEIDYLNGEVVRLAKRLKKRAPVNTAIVDLVKQAELGVEHLWSPEDLRAHVLQGHKVAPVFGY